MGIHKKPLDRFILESPIKTEILKCILSSESPVTFREIADGQPDANVYPHVHDLINRGVIAVTTGHKHVQRQYYSFIESPENMAIANQIMRSELCQK